MHRDSSPRPVVIPQVYEALLVVSSSVHRHVHRRRNYHHSGAYSTPSQLIEDSVDILQCALLDLHVEFILRQSEPGA